MPDRFELENEMNAPLKGFRRYPRGKRRHGYASPPGTGPKGETCKSCGHLARARCAKTHLKCKLMERHWTGGYGTDVKVAAPACRFWEKPDAAR